MLNFSKKLRSIVLVLCGLLALVLVVSSCSPTKKAPGSPKVSPFSDDEPMSSSDVSFKIKSIKKTQISPGVLGQGPHGQVWQVEEKKDYLFSVCLALQDTNREVPEGQRFDVEFNKKIFVAHSDSNGCINWKIPLEYNFFVHQSRYLLIDSKIWGRGVQKGWARALYAVNPWAPFRRGKVEEVVNLNFGNPLQPWMLQKVARGEDVSTALMDVTEKAPLRMKVVEKNITKVRELRLSDFNYSDGSKKSSTEGSKDQTNNHPKESNSQLDEEAQAWREDLWRIDLDDKNNEKVNKKLKALINANKKLGNNEGLLLSFQLRLEPEVILKNIAGIAEPYSLSAGSYEIHPMIIATDLGENGNKYTPLTPGLKPKICEFMPNEEMAKHSKQPCRIDSRGIFLNFKAPITMQSFQGRLALALRVKPRRAPIKKYDGLYIIGEHGQLRGSSKGWLERESPKFDMYKYLQAGMDEKEFDEFMEARKGLLGMGSYFFDELRVDYKEIAEGETATTRSVRYVVKLCIYDPNKFSEPVRATEFKIEKEAKEPYKYIVRTGEKDLNDKVVERSFVPVEPRLREGKENNGLKHFHTTNMRGCIEWEQTIKHKYYQKETHYYPVIRVSGRNTKPKELIIRINPWFESYRIFGLDATDMNPMASRKVYKSRRWVPPSRFWVAGFSYQTIQFRYELDPFLNLKIYKAVLMRLEPYVLRYNSLVSGLKSIEKLRDGIYLMKIGITKDYLDPSSKVVKIKKVKSPSMNSPQFKAQVDNEAQVRQFITVVRKLVRVNAGNIITPVEFSMRDLRLMRIRSQLVVQLETIDEEKLMNAHKYEDLLLELFNGQGDQKEKWSDLKLAVGESSLNYKKTKSERRAILNSILKRQRKQHLDVEKCNEIRKEIETDPNLPAEEVGRPKRFKYDSNTMLECLAQQEPDSPRYKDFTISNTAPNVTLDLLRGNKPSGLAPRSFVGPVTLLRNGNHSHLRPTDNLDEAFCIEIDCDQIKNDERLPPESFIKGYEKENEKKYNKFYERIGEDNSEESSSEKRPGYLEILRRKFNRTFCHLKRFYGDISHLSTRENKSCEELAKDEMARDESISPEPVAQPKSEKPVPTFKDEDEELDIEYLSCESLEDLERLTIESVASKKKVPLLDRLICQYRLQEQDYARRMKSLSQLVNFLALNNLKYVSLKDRPLRTIKDGCWNLESEECFRDLNAKENIDFRVLLDGFLSQDYLNFEDLVKVDWRFHLGEHPGRGGTIQAGERMDRYRKMGEKRFREMSRENLKEQLFGLFRGKKKSDGRISLKAKSENLLQHICMKSVDQVKNSLDRDDLKFNGLMNALGAKLYDKFILGKDRFMWEACRNARYDVKVEPRYRVKYVSDVLYQGGMSMNVNVGASGTLNVGGGYGFSVAGRFDPVSFAEALLPESVEGKLKGLNLNLGGSYEESIKEYQGTNISRQTFLVMQQSTIEFALRNYEKCLIFTMSPQWVKRFVSELVGVDMIPKYQWLVNQGYFVCEGEDKTNFEEDPRGQERTIERFYYFTQHFTEGDMQDIGDIYNHPWLYAIRGDSEFYKFMTLMNAQPRDLGSPKKMEKVLGELAGRTLWEVPQSWFDSYMGNYAQTERMPFVSDRYALRHMANVYRDVIPTFPGLYTPIDSVIHYLDQGEWLGVFNKNSVSSSDSQERFLKSVCPSDSFQQDYCLQISNY